MRPQSSSTNVDWRIARRNAWLLSIGMATLGIVALAGLFWDTATSAMKLWWGQPTYNYAFLIPLISGYLIWHKRDDLRTETPGGSFWGIAFTAVFGLVWLLSEVAEINEGRHIAFVGMMLGILLACLGWRIFKILSFPFLYLWLLVPTGTLVLPQLQEIATLISSSLLRWIGIPVFVDGFFLEVPSGRYHIEPGCAGLNFLLATAALAPLYAYLFYRSFWKRLVVVGLALILAIIMNGVRIAGIIALAHWGGPKLNIVDNHLLYGWGFFALVLFAAGYVGSYFAEAPLAAPTPEKPELALRQDIVRSPARTVGAGLLSLLVAACILNLAEEISSPAPVVFDPYPKRLVVPGWRNVPWSADWSPSFANADQKLKQSYERNDETVDLFVATYSRQTRGHELIAYDNSVTDQTRWSTLSQRHHDIDCSSKTLPITQLEVSSDDRRRHVWLFYWVDGTFTADPLLAKLLEVKAKLFFGDPRAAIVAVASSEQSQGYADTALDSFLEAALPPIEALLQASSTTASISPVITKASVSCAAS